MSETDEFIPIYHLMNIFKYFSEKGIIQTAIIAVLSYRLNEILNDVFESMVLPFINININGTPLIDYEFKLNNTRVKLGKTIISILKLLIIAYVIYIVAYYYKI